MQKSITHFLHRIEEYFDHWKYGLSERWGGRRALMIQPYRGFGLPQRIYLKGRVLENKGITSPRESDGLWDNLRNMYRRFESDEIPYAQVLGRFGGATRAVGADEEGYFDLWLEPTQSLPSDRLWHSVKLKLLHPRPSSAEMVQAEGEVLIPPPTARFGVISDIDDTVVYTASTNLLRMVQTVFLGNARTRRAFSGVAAFYQALQAGKQAKEGNPIFYVSSSPWNLYDLLSDFFALNGIPAGPILLRDWGITEEEVLPTGHRSYKLKWIHSLLNTFSNLPFILIGDNSQEDPEIYRELVRLYPGRILAIYIRNITRQIERSAEVNKLAEEMTGQGTPFLLAEDTFRMAEHAAGQGWIAAPLSPEPAISEGRDAA